MGTSLEDVKIKMHQDLYNSEEYKNARVKYEQELRKAGLTEHGLEYAYEQIHGQLQQYRQSVERLNHDCQERLGGTISEASEKLRYIRYNMLTSKQVQERTEYLKEPKNNALLRKMEEQIREERPNKKNTQEDPDQGDGR